MKQNRKIILDDIINLNINKHKWLDWPEKDIYNTNAEWKVLPFIGFGKHIPKYCKLCPNIYKIVKKLPGCRTALLSKLTPNTHVFPHQGWMSLSNNILRCHYVIKSNNDCILAVEDETTIVKENEIIVFDDAKMHQAKNLGKTDKIVLIVDFDRPSYVKKGVSTMKNSSELDNFIQKCINS